MAIRTVLTAAVIALAASMACAQSQGVSKNEIVLGTIQDLSGPLAAYGKQARNGMQLRIDEANEQGGVYERKLKLAVEDSGYDPKKAVLAAQKLVEQEKIFALLGHIGTAPNIAAMPVLFDKGVINFLPLTGAREMYENPPHKLKYALLSPYYEQMRLALPKLVAEKKAEKVCIIYQDDDFGNEVLKGAEAGLKSMGKDLVEKTTFKRGATDFSSQVQKMKSAGCDFVVLGTIIRETVGTIAESRKNGFNPTFLGTVAAYSDLIHKLGGKAVDGMYATMTSQMPYTDETDLAIRFWANKYKTRFNEDPTIFSVYGYTIVDMFIKGARKTGPQLTTEGFLKAMDLTSFPSDSFGSPKMYFAPGRRLGSDASRLSQITDGRWKVVSDYFGTEAAMQAKAPPAAATATKSTTNGKKPATKS
ncbi:ABC transporter substrate-binding protein [Ramlibacter sp. PS4R-6]|uniref:ABC transporter substrate-binding protein n=1 Tax=Ramlibacter sp. PS4R-6 TaxID=3133438 RepID=UPI0030AEAAD7